MHYFLRTRLATMPTEGSERSKLFILECFSLPVNHSLLVRKIYRACIVGHEPPQDTSLRILVIDTSTSGVPAAIWPKWVALVLLKTEPSDVLNRSELASVVKVQTVPNDSQSGPLSYCQPPMRVSSKAQTDFLVASE